ncbi:GNAT family N-acetyltransferase [Dactylosporangium sucinum]|uniref:N-acetyltransferase domain-containing protein n=1 Tax=Dactylosporangium sucinum TaxID=1424081 RepID=A0A917U9N4_9ACTN|nr:GNAT family N-acetyltransferase [Dactylosporangium sucinum]GGM67601.1 hypothetical protein GCM10007977_081730 [Dactylosporangium sucinum]
MSAEPFLLSRASADDLAAWHAAYAVMTGAPSPGSATVSRTTDAGRPPTGAPPAAPNAAPASATPGALPNTAPASATAPASPTPNTAPTSATAPASPTPNTPPASATAAPPPTPNGPPVSAAPTAADDGMLRWVSRDGAGAIAGIAVLRGGYLRLYVAPAARRRGHGTALVAAAGRAGRDGGHARLRSAIPAGPPAEAFAERLPGYEVLLRLQVQEQRLDHPGVAERCRAVLAVDGYELRHWRDRAPDELALSFARVMAHVLDAPGAELQMPPRDWDLAAVRAWERDMTAGGMHLLVTAATASGGVVAATVTLTRGAEAEQHDTAVLPDHRRRGLATWIKAAQTLRLRAEFPAATSATTTVNVDNHGMLAANRTVGYRDTRRRLLVEVTA